MTGPPSFTVVIGTVKGTGPAQRTGSAGLPGLGAIEYFLSTGGRHVLCGAQAALLWTQHA